MPAMASSGQQSEPLNIQLLVDSIPALIHTGRPDGYLVKWYGSSLDIDERKTTEEQLRSNTEALQRSEFYLAEGQRLGHMGSWAFDPGGFYYWSPELFRIHGLDPAGEAP